MLLRLPNKNECMYKTKNLKMLCMFNDFIGEAKAKTLDEKPMDDAFNNLIMVMVDTFRRLSYPIKKECKFRNSNGLHYCSFGTWEASNSSDEKAYHSMLANMQLNTEDVWKERENDTLT